MLPFWCKGEGKLRDKKYKTIFFVHLNNSPDLRNNDVATRKKRKKKITSRIFLISIPIFYQRDSLFRLLKASERREGGLNGNEPR